MFDSTGLQRLTADLLGSARVAVEAVEITEHAAQHVEDRARSLAPKGPSLPYYAETITHEVHVNGATIVGEIGPESGGQGSLGHILEDGTATSPPHPHLGPAIDEEMDAYAAELLTAGARAVR